MNACGEGLGAVLSQSIEGHDHVIAYASRTFIKQNENIVNPDMKRWHLCGLFHTLGHTCMASDSQRVLTTVHCNGYKVFMNLKVKWSGG